MRMEYYFDPDDRLERKKYAEFLKSMLENCDKYRREDSDGAYVIAIDSPWGTGKTRFAKMLRNYLEGRKPKLSAGKVNQAMIPKPDSKREFNVIYYNSWEVDYWTDAIEPLISNIINSDVFKEFREDEQNKELWNQFKNFAKGVLEASIDVAAEFSIWGKILNILVRGVKKTRERVNKPFEEFDKRKKLYSNFAESLSKIISKTGKKLVIIVDELDRCRPTFAVQTLELVKHLFAVKGLIFIFALDIKQLSCSVQTIYGQEMDAAGYLCRFFDYLVKMPSQDVKAFIEELLIKADTKSIFDKLYDKERRTTSRTVFIEFVYDLSEKASLSLRDLTTIFETFHLMIDSFLNQYHSVEAMKLYFLILLIKYKYIDLFRGLFSTKRITEEAGAYFKRHLGFALDNTLLSELMKIYDSDVIASRAFMVSGASGENLGGGTIISSVSGDSNNMTIAWNLRNDNANNTHSVIYRQECCFDGLLYNADIIKWDQIKNLTLAQYFHQQLEMFNFALPADEPATQS